MFAIDATDTSNICSNQAFVATLVGAALLERGAAGLRRYPKNDPNGTTRCGGCATGSTFIFPVPLIRFFDYERLDGGLPEMAKQITRNNSDAWDSFFRVLSYFS